MQQLGTQGLEADCQDSDPDPQNHLTRRSDRQPPSGFSLVKEESATPLPYRLEAGDVLITLPGFERLLKNMLAFDLERLSMRKARYREMHTGRFHFYKIKKKKNRERRKCIPTPLQKKQRAMLAAPGVTS